MTALKPIDSIKRSTFSHFPKRKTTWLLVAAFSKPSGMVVKWYHTINDFKKEREEHCLGRRCRFILNQLHVIELLLCAVASSCSKESDGVAASHSRLQAAARSALLQVGRGWALPRRTCSPCCTHRSQSGLSGVCQCSHGHLSARAVSPTTRC